MAISGRRYDTNESVAITLADDCITAIAPIADDPALPWIIPGLIDLQVNGYGGYGFNNPALEPEHLDFVTQSMLAGNVTMYLPTCTTDSFELLARSMSIMAQAIEQSPLVRRSVPGFHLEGPYISPEDGPRGAHPKQHVRPPSWDEFLRLQDAAAGKILLVTLSAEYEESPAFIERAVAGGVVVAIGHTKANSEQIKRAVDSGATLSTHLGNGAHPLIRRHPNYIWDQLADDRLMASIIADGHHLHPSVVKSMVRAKSPERIILVSDVTDRGGMAAGRYSTPLGDVEVLDDGRLVVAGQRDILAGASLPLMTSVRNVMQFAGVDFKTAIDMATANPARLMGWPAPKIEGGARVVVVNQKK